VLPRVGSLKQGSWCPKTRELVLPRVGSLKKGICVSKSCALKRIGVLHNHKLFSIKFVILVKYIYNWFLNTSPLLIYYDD
jgi:hypothetical protein